MNISCADRKDIKQFDRKKIYVVLDRIRSAFNVGSIIRSCDGFAAAEILFCGYTPLPTHPKVKKTSLGAEEVIQWRHFDELSNALAYLREKSIKIYALETIPTAPKLGEFVLTKPLAVVVGHECDGLSEESIKMCDQAVQIPMLGRKNSLNVATALSIFLFAAS